MTVNELGTALNSIKIDSTSLKFKHFAWSKAPTGDYGVYAEDGADDFITGNIHVEKSTTGYIHYFTRDDSGAPRTAIEAKLNEIQCAWNLNTVQYEDDTGYIHYEWAFKIYG